MSAPIIRILLRYLAMGLVTKGFLDADTASWVSNDPDLLAGLQIAVGVAAAVAAEAWYFLARKFGWSK